MTPCGTRDGLAELFGGDARGVLGTRGARVDRGVCGVRGVRGVRKERAGECGLRGVLTDWARGRLSPWTRGVVGCVGEAATLCDSAAFLGDVRATERGVAALVGEPETL